MGRYKLVASDLDGTLLDSRGQVSPRAKRAIERVVEQGVHVALTTARRYVGTAPVADELGLAGPLILYDGALVRHHPRGTIFLRMPLTSDVVRDVAMLMAEHDLRPIVQTLSRDRERLLVPPAPSHHDFDGAFLKGFSQQVQTIELERLHVAAEEPLRVVAFGPANLLAPVQRLLRTAPAGAQLLPLGSYGSAELTVFAPQASKGAALAALASSLGVSMSDVFAIGDSINDLSMLRAAGMSVAMKNGHPLARKAARALTLSNDEDGFAIALERYVLDDTDSVE